MSGAPGFGKGGSIRPGTDRELMKRVMSKPRFGESRGLKPVIRRLARAGSTRLSKLCARSPYRGFSAEEKANAKILQEAKRKEKKLKQLEADYNSSIYDEYGTFAKMQKLPGITPNDDDFRCSLHAKEALLKVAGGKVSLALKPFKVKVPELFTIEGAKAEQLKMGDESDPFVPISEESEVVEGQYKAYQEALEHEASMQRYTYQWLIRQGWRIYRVKDIKDKMRPWPKGFSKLLYWFEEKYDHVKVLGFYKP